MATIFPATTVKPITANRAAVGPPGNRQLQYSFGIRSTDALPS